MLIFPNNNHDPALNLAMEEYIVDRDFIIEPEVLNHTVGGDDTRHDTPQVQNKVPDYQLPKEACDVIESFGANIPPAPKSVQNEPKKRKGNFYTFADLSVAIAGRAAPLLCTAQGYGWPLQSCE